MFAHGTKAFIAYLQIGVHADRSRDDNQKLLASNLFAFIGYTITLTLAINATIKGNVALLTSLFLASVIFFCCHHIHRFPKLGNTISLSTRVIFLNLLLLMLYLVHSGGASNTGPLWIYLLPPVAFFFSGLRNGLKEISAFTLLLIFMLFYPDDILLNTIYTLEFKIRLIYSFLTVSMLFGFYEYSRQQSYNYIQALSQNYEQQAMHDDLTHLPNRRGIRVYLNHEYSRLLRSKEPFSILVCDIDHFKQVNDNYYHDGGDFVLTSLSAFFTKQIRQQDIVARWGGEEFLFLLPNTSLENAVILAEKIREQVQDHTIHYKGNAIRISISIGVNEVTSDVNIDQAINIADHSLYLAKKEGRNKTVSANTIKNSK
jgi:diguanylate cyclase (GGDEF)-like protein